MRVVLADKQADVRSAVRLLVTHNMGMRVVGEAADASTLWHLVQDSRPDLLLLDWRLLGASASAAPARLHAAYPNLRVIVLSEHAEVRRHALAAGADGFVSKADSPEQMIDIVRSACAERNAGGADENSEALGGDTNV
jgi:DNA-binding NarL/FixJ family response regulator